MRSHFAYSFSPSPSCGVLSADTFTPLALHGCTVSVELHVGGARVTVRYAYDNHSGREQRVLAAYPLPPGWALLHCRAEHAGDVAQTTHRRRTDATPPALFDRRAPPVAVQRLPWPVAAAGRVGASATYFAPLAAARTCGALCLRLPRRLFPPHTQQPAARAAYDGPFALPAAPLPPGWAIDVRADAAAPIDGPAALTDAPAARVDYVGDTAFTARAAGPGAWVGAGGVEAVCALRPTAEPLRFFAARDRGAAVAAADRHALAVSFTPQLDPRRGCGVNAEFVVLAELRGPAAAAAAGPAIAAALRALPASARVNVVVVGDAADWALAPNGAVPVADAPLEAMADTVVAMGRHGRGVERRLARGKGQTRQTEAAPWTAGAQSPLHRALRQAARQNPHALCGPVAKGYVRHVVAVTDSGHAADAALFLEEAAQRAGNLTFSAIAVLFRDARSTPSVAAPLPAASAVGRDGPNDRLHAAAVEADAALLELLAAEGGGAYAEALTPAALPAALSAVLTRLAVPTLTDIHFAVDEPEVRVAGTSTFAAVPQGMQRFVYALAPEEVKSVGVCVTGRVGETMIEYVGRTDFTDAAEVEASESPARCNPMTIGLLHLAAAEARVRFLVETDRSATFSSEVSRLSRAFMLPSPFTEMHQQHARVHAAAAVVGLLPPSNNPMAEKHGASLVAVRFAPRSWTYPGMLQERRTERLAGQTASTETAAPIPTPTLPSTREWTVGSTTTSSRDFLRALVTSIAESVCGPPSMKRLATLQSGDGSFPLSARLATCVGLSLERLERDVPLADVGVSEDLQVGRECLKSHERVWATAVAAAAMERRGDEATEMAYGKAISYVTTHDTDGGLLRHARQVMDASIRCQPSISV